MGCTSYLNGQAQPKTTYVKSAPLKKFLWDFFCLNIVLAHTVPVGAPPVHSPDYVLDRAG